MDEHSVPATPEQRPEDGAPARSDTGAMMDRLAPAERLVLIGAAIVLADFILFELIIGDYFFFWVTWLLAGWALAAGWLRHSRADTAWPVPYDAILKVLAITMGAIGIASLIYDLRYETLDGTGEILGAVIFYVGAAIMWWGSRGLQRS